MTGPSRALIAAAVPRGMRRAGSQKECLRTLEEMPAQSFLVAAGDSAGMPRRSQ
ncbi:hypothetical protein [Nonomuraea sp. JJY05]|uniref:hypothetical protein n=1 Tax=Nonomuraea sp. JJY05 TaxID=3350255 RepID=UPI00373F53B5